MKERYEGAEWQKVWQNGMEAGIAKGEAKNKKEVILNMHKKKIKIEDICDIVNLPKEEVERIINEDSLK